jgi:hypothetical protein
MKNTNRNIKQKKCKYCETLFYPIKTTATVCTWECANLLAKEKSEKKKAKEWNVRKKELKEGLMSLQDWIKIAQTHVNTYINLRDKNKPCISCFKPIRGRVNASHYFNANNHWNVRFNEDNIHSSCITCNQYLSGNLINYRIGLIERIGLDCLEHLESIANETRKFTIPEVKEIIETYKEKIKTLKNS